MRCPDGDALALFLEDRASPAEREQVQVHLADCGGCTAVVAALWPLHHVGSATAQAPPPPLQREQPLAPGTLLGRFRVEERLGGGGMGVVYLAHDPALDRKVAVKLIRSDIAHVEMPARLQREAQALARLTDPHVVTVHDVGVAEGRIFIAMEYLEGTTAREWIRDGERTWRETLAFYARAGQGLAAAHAAGLVHRDFKPSNVLVGHDGRVKVADFGLVRLAHAEDPSPIPVPVQDPLETQPGAVLGTPAYMAPEQLAGRVAGPASDQFAFCVALHEALYGARPFADNARPGPLPPTPAESRVPAWVRRVVERGLQADPAARHPSMAALLSALARDPTVTWRRAAWASAFVALVGVAAFGVLRAPGGGVCKGGASRLTGVWDDPIKRTIQDAMLATHKPYAADTFARVEQILDGRASAWVTMYTDSCEATHVRGEQSPQLLDLRTRCLDRRRAEMGALTALLSKKPDADVVAQAIDASLALPGLDACADSEALSAAVPLPQDQGARVKIDALLTRIEAAEALLQIGKYAEGLPIAAAVVADARLLGYAPAEARALLVLGRLERDAGDLKTAEPTLRDASTAAARAKDDRILAAIWTDMMDLTGARQARHGEAMALAPVAEATVERAGGNADLRARMLGTLAEVLRSMGDPKEALKRTDEAIDVLEKAHAMEAPYLAVLHNHRGICLAALERYDLALTSFERALALEVKIHGAEHPRVAQVNSNVGGVFGRREKYEIALPYFDRAVRILEKTQGLEHPALGPALSGMGQVLSGLGRYDEALVCHQRTLNIWSKALRPDHPNVGKSLNNIGNVLLMQKKFAEATSYYRRSLAVKEKTFGPDHPSLSSSLANIGNSLVEEGKPAEGRPYLARALAIVEKTSGPESLAVAQYLTLLALCDLALKQPRAALPPLERVLGILERKGADGAPHRAEAEFGLARALWETGGDRGRAVKLAERARQGYADDGKGQVDQLAKVTAWLKAHPPRGR